MTRLEKLQQKMAAQELPALLVTAPKNVTYLSGFTGDESALLISADDSWFITDSRYTAQAAVQVKDFTIVCHQHGLYQEAAALADRGALTTVGIEADDLNVATFQRLTQLFSHSELVPTSGLIEQIREVKDAAEIALLRQAIQITDDCFDYLLGYVEAGMTELQVATEMEYFMRQHGASGSSFATIVASGFRSAWPHGVASTKKIEQHELVTFDFGCYFQGYTSDITRTVAVGEPTAKAYEIYDLVLQANQAVIAATKPGVTGGEINDLAHGMIATAGYGPNFGHGTGHGIGLDIHEGPGAWGIYQKQPLVAGNVVTDEPGIYIEDFGGVRIEDDLLVTANGCEVLTKAPKEALIVL
ncbi:M24 family metallopeptidase [Lapidilactobacillus salsurivasis]